MRQAFGHAGWVRFEDPERFDGVVYLHVTADGRVRELYLTGADDITPASVRNLRLAQYRASALGRADLLPMGLGVDDPDIAAQVARLFADTRSGQRENRTVDRKRLVLPPGRRLDDAFLRSVAEAYRGALGEGLRPNKTLAADVGHENSRTVERWVYLARKAGHLSRTGQGEAR